MISGYLATIKLQAVLLDDESVDLVVDVRFKPATMGENIIRQKDLPFCLLSRTSLITQYFYLDYFLTI